MYRPLPVVVALAALVAGPAGAGPAPRGGSAGVTVALPAGWHSTRGLQGAITNPLTRVVVSSGPIGPKLSGACTSQIADYTFPATAVAIVVVEWTVPLGRMKIGSGPRRPRRFTAANLRIHRPPAIECFDGPGGGAEFAQGGRSLAAYALLGRKAPSSLAVRARTVLDTLRVAPR